MLVRLPWLLVLFRVVAGPVMIALAAAGQGPACAVVLSLGVLSDIFDGIIARRLGVATPALRTWDSRADVLFWASAVIAVVVLRPELLPVLWPPAALIMALEIANHAFSFAKFRREASPHHYLSKVFGLGLWLLFGLAFATGRPAPVLLAVLGLGVASQLEAFTITLRLRMALRRAVGAQPQITAGRVAALQIRAQPSYFGRTTHCFPCGRPLRQRHQPAAGSGRRIIAC